MLDSGMTSRPGLIRRLMGSPHPAVTLLTAPAGCGKTTLLAEWAEADPRRFAWVQLTAADDDPRPLLRTIAAALETVSPRMRRAFHGGSPIGGKRGMKALSRHLADTLSNSS